MAVVPSQAPITTTQAATSVTAISATLNGTLVDTGIYLSGGVNYPDTVAEKGFCWGTNENPDVTGDHASVAGGTPGAYTYALTGLTINTTYHVRTYATGTTSGLTGYGNDITFVYMGPTSDFQKSYIYKVFRDGDYLGNLPNVEPDFAFSQDINTVGSQVDITCGVSADTSMLSVENLLDEAGNILTDESDVALTTEGLIPIVTPGNSGINTLVKNGNKIEIWEYGYYHPNGKCMFIGTIESWSALFGGTDEDLINITVYSDGQDLDNYLVRGYPYTYTADQSQVTQDGYDTNSTGLYGISWNREGQSWVAGVTNLGAIDLYLNGTATVTILVYSDYFNGTLIGSVTKSVDVTTPTAIKFAFANPITTSIGATYYFAISVASGQSIKVYKKATNPYANGTMFSSSYGGGSGGGSYSAVPGSDLYFKTYSGTGATICTFTSLDPSTGMLELMMDDYNSRGGVIGYDSTTIDATGLSLTYSLNTNTTLEGIRAMLTLAPDSFYYYVDPGTQQLHFKQASATPDIILTKGTHLSSIRFVASIEMVKNSVYFTGGATAGVNLYKQYSDPTSLDLYGMRLDRLTDNRVTVAGTADAIGGSDLAEKKDEQYHTVITVLDKTMDITLLKPGMVVGLNGFGTFVDYITAQVVRVDYKPESATLTLGILPPRTSMEFDKITRGLVAMQTILNPTSPS